MKKITLLLIFVLALFSGCASDSAADIGAPHEGDLPNAGVGQSGAQDFGRFRSLIENGEIPAPNTLDPIGFFNEHKVELPAPDCGQDVCLHAEFGVQGNMINGANCTVVMLGFNTPRNAEEFQRPPLNMAIALDVSREITTADLSRLQSGLLAFVESIDEKDEVTFLTFSDQIQSVYFSDPAEDSDRNGLRTAIRQASTTTGGSNVYEGLRRALSVVDDARDTTRQNRVIFASPGIASAGITDHSRIVNLAESYAAQGVGITSIGIGERFEIEVMRRLADAGAGTFYFIEDYSTIETVFTREARTFQIPLAEDIEIIFDAEPAYAFRGAYGIQRWEGTREQAFMQIPALFMASRTAVEDVGPGEDRRGGGGMILLELVPTIDPAILEATPPGAPVGTLRFSWKRPGSEQPIEQEVVIYNPLRPGESPQAGEFESSSVEKAFVTLNVYAGFKMSIERYSSGSAAQALAVLLPLIDSVTEWNQQRDDLDIRKDLELMVRLAELMEAERGSEVIGEPPNPWPFD